MKYFFNMLDNSILSVSKSSQMIGHYHEKMRFAKINKFLVSYLLDYQVCFTRVNPEFSQMILFFAKN